MLTFSKLARSHTQCLYFVIILSIQRYAISNKRELHCVRADVFGDLKIYVSEALARFARPRIKISYFFFCRYIWGSCPPPPPNTKKLATLVCVIIMIVFCLLYLMAKLYFVDANPGC